MDLSYKKSQPVILNVSLGLDWCTKGKNFSHISLEPCTVRTNSAHTARNSPYVRQEPLLEILG